MDTLDLIKAFFDSPVLNSTVDSLTGFVVTICSATIPLFYCIAWVWSYVKTSFLNIGEKPKFLEKEEILRGAVLWFLVITYQPLFGAIESLAFQIIEATEPSNYIAWKANHGAMVVEIMNPSSPQLPSEENAEGGMFSSGMSSGILDPNALAVQISQSFFSMLFSILGYLASTVAGGISYLLSKVFFIIGPLAITFSVLPNFKDKLNKWFGTWLGVTMNLLTLNLLTTMLIGVTLESMESIGVTLASGAGNFSNGANLSIMIFNAIIVILYILSFWVTSYFVGTSDAGKVLSTAVGAVTSMMAYGAMKSGAISSIGGPGGSIKSSVPNVLDATRNTK